MHFKSTWKTNGMCFAMGYAVYYFMRDYVNELMFKLLFNDIIWNLTDNLVIDMVLFFMILMIPVTMIHEWIHGMAYKLFGGKVKYEFKGIYIKARDVSGIAIHRSKFLLIIMAPMTIISLISLAIPSWIGGLLLLLNIFKSTGDILRVFYVFKGNCDTYVIDKKDGFEIVGEGEAIQLTFENLPK